MSLMKERRGVGKAWFISIDLYVRRLYGLEDKMVCSLNLATGMVMGCIQEFIYCADWSEFLKRVLMGLGVDR